MRLRHPVSHAYPSISHNQIEKCAGADVLQSVAVCCSVLQCVAVDMGRQRSVDTQTSTL